jgi:hypothetical protein
LVWLAVTGTTGTFDLAEAAFLRGPLVRLTWLEQLLLSGHWYLWLVLLDFN